MAEEPTIQSLPDDLCVSVQGNFEQEEAEKLGHIFLHMLKQFSSRFDLSNLDGVTIASDYQGALSKLDRGTVTSTTLQATDDRVLGVAMAPMVLRDGALKSHLVFNALIMNTLFKGSESEIRQGLHIVAHECSHVEFNTKFDKCFPDISLKKVLPSITEMLRFNAGQSAWDEYFATLFSASFGDSGSEAYRETFLTELALTENVVFESLKSYQLHGDVAKTIEEVGSTLGRLMKFSGYLIGDSLGKNMEPIDIDEISQTLEHSWFKPYFNSLVKNLKALNENYGEWSSFNLFDAILINYDSLLEHFGVIVENSDTPSPYVHFYK
ncbi:MAG: hypothetical protein ACW7DR_09030 [Paraglaciecola chathamensis]